MAQFEIYRSTDGSAPTLDGQAGSLVAVLDACLRTGYGSKTGAGWTKPYTGTNKAAFQQGAGSGFLLRIQDDGPGAATTQEARVRGYESMSDVDTGSGPFPTVAQQANGLFVRKSAAANGTARDWIVLADARTAYIAIKSEVASAASGNWYAWMFGDFFSLVPGDAYNCMIIARTTENSSSVSSGGRLGNLSAAVAPNQGHYAARGYAGTGGSIAVGKQGDAAKANGNTDNYGVITFPNPADGGLYLSPIWIIENSNTVRGRMRGYWHQCHAQGSFADCTNSNVGDTASGAGDLSGKSFLFIRPDGNSAVFPFETSNTLETNS